MKSKFLVLFLSLSLAAWAQTPPRMIRLSINEVPGDQYAEFMSVQREFADVYHKAKPAIFRNTFQSLTGKPTFVIVLPLANLAALDEPTWSSQQGTEAERTARTNRLNRSGGARRSLVLTLQEAQSWDPTPNGPPEPFIMVAVYSVKPGKVIPFLSQIKVLGEAIKKQGKAESFSVTRATFGGDAYAFHVVIGFKSLADMAAGPAEMRATMGDAAYTDWVAKMGETVNSMDRDIYRYNARTSYTPEAK